VSSKSVDTRGVPDSLEYQPGAGSYDVNVYECVVCGDLVNGTEEAIKHDTCQLPRECPGCGSIHARPSLATNYDRVDVCRACGSPFHAGGDP